MKKFLILLVGLIGITNVRADISLYYYDSGVRICDQENKYDLVRVYLNNRLVYLIDYSSKYDLDNSIYTINDEAKLDEDLLNITSYQNIAITYNTDYFYTYISRMILEKKYNKDLYFCNDNKEVYNLDLEEEYHKLKSVVNSLINEDLFNKEIIIQENDNYVLTNELLKYYDIVSYDENLNVILNEDDELIIQGPEGNYEISFKLKPNNHRNIHLFTDQKNYLVSAQTENKKEFLLKVKIINSLTNDVDTIEEPENNDVDNEIIDNNQESLGNLENTITFIPENTLILLDLLLPIVFGVYLVKKR